MPLDAICLSAVIAELQPGLENMRVDKVTQPERDEIVLHMRTTSRENVKLLLCANPSSARLHFTTASKPNPQTAPMFCMLLRKHLTGARLLSFEQPKGERVVKLTFSGYDELGDTTTRILLLEMIGRTANLFFMDAENRIIAALRQSNADITTERANLPGMMYQEPTPPDKYYILTLGIFDWRRIFAQEGQAAEIIRAKCYGFSPLAAREAVYHALGDCTAFAATENADQLAAGCFEFFQNLQEKNFKPVLLRQGDVIKDFYCTEIGQYDDWQVETCESFNRLLDTFYAQTYGAQALQRKKASLQKTVKSKVDRVTRKIAAQRQELHTAIDREHWRKQGELLKANLHIVQKGAEAVIVDDYYEMDCPELTIKLDPLLTPQQNAAKFFKNYAKAKTAEAMLNERLMLGEQELAYWLSVHEAIQRCENERELQEIKDEVHPDKISKKGKKQSIQSRPYQFLSSSGLRIFAGRNNTQNETLTLRTARKTDLWLHAQKMPGAHVIVEALGQEPDDKTLEEAAIIAATLSAAKNGVKVPIDYTLVKHVKKLPKSHLGMVNYEQFSTIYADADAGLLEKLKI
ncbi:MAG: NFACT family protein [Oscillospiraceae bacterium]|nr:NFACT family protein [Oscillospiraceae bacterium]